ncbi:putative peroxisomal peroxiredoxin [Candida viswanathii]|uniref:Putative peroxisomal peroxiredoxin n=1 Tax=Candida viswanathii TaxID=5486 RepID=A0A367Y1L0_9ASCO|nr:putative peroxisomal peroxiredoxin [Candida viswanathii]
MTQFPTNINPKYIPFSKENSGVLTCGNPIDLNLKDLFKDSTVVVTGAPGPFTPVCSEQHIPDYLKHLKDFKDKGVKKVVVLTANDPFVMAAWGKALGYTDEENYIIFATDPNAEISKELGEDFVVDLSSAGFGLRLQRYAALVVNGDITYLKSEKDLGFTDISSAETILKKIA